MQQDKIPIIVVVAAVVLCGIGWTFVPSLQDAQRTVDEEAAVHIERARRLLHQYNASLEYSALLLDQLAEADVDVDIEDPQDLVDYAGEEYQELHEALWESFEPTDWEADPPRPARARYSDLSGQVRDGVEGRDDLIDRNDWLLDEAMTAVDEALAVTSGDASAGSNPEANRLKAMILFQRGLVERIRASVKRAEAPAYRRGLLELAGSVAREQGSQSLVADSGIDEQIGMVRAEIDRSQERLAEQRESLARMDELVEGLESQLATLTSQAESARMELERIRAEGVDFSNPNGAETFERRLMEQDRVYREADRQARTLEAGGFPQAEIDATGDFLRGRYLENGAAGNLTVELGLAHHRVERTIRAGRAGRERQAIDDLRSDLARLEGIREELVHAQARARERVAEAGPLGADAYAELNRVESEAAVTEDDALDLLERSTRLFRQAASSAGQWATDGSERTSDLSAEAQERSAHNTRSGSGWMEGHIAAQAADARLARAWIYYDRFEAYSRDAQTIAAATKLLPLAEADVEVERERAAEARDAGIEEVKEAMSVLERAHKSAERHWTFMAQAAGTTYLMVLFGQNDYLPDTIESYREALQGREDKPFTATLANRLQRLENR